MTRLEMFESIRAALEPGTVMRCEDLVLMLGVSERTIYRRIREMKAAGAPIKGEAGIGYMLMTKGRGNGTGRDLEIPAAAARTADDQHPG